MCRDPTRSLVSTCRKMVILRLWSGVQEQNTCAFSENSTTGNVESSSARKMTMVVSNALSRPIQMVRPESLTDPSTRFRSRAPMTAGWTETRLGPRCRCKRDNVISTACSGTQRRSLCGLIQTASKRTMKALEFTSRMWVWPKKRAK